MSRFPGDTVSRRHKARALAGISAISARSLLAYRFNLIFGLVSVLVQVYLLHIVWDSVYDGRSSVNGVRLDMQVAYSSLAMLQAWMLSPWNPSDIAQRVRDGTIALDLLRPVRFLPQSLAGQIGAVLAMVPFAVVTVPVAILIGGAAGPASALALGEYLLALMAGFAVATLLALMVSMVTFWTLEVQGINMTYRMVQQFCSGALVPLWFMPGWLRDIANLLPFQALGYTPLAIYLGRLNPAHGALLLAEEAGWIVALALLLRLIWSRALHRVVVQGG